jgi:hypothetical protein
MHPYDPIERLNWSINWHTPAHRQVMRWYASLKVIEILAAAAIPIVTTPPRTHRQLRDGLPGSAP